MNVFQFSLLSTAMLLSAASWSQTVVLSEEEYNSAKLTGTLPLNARPETRILSGSPVPSEGGLRGGGGGQNECNCWIEPDASYTLAMEPNDDGSSGVIAIPFDFNLYGDLYTNLYINNNGNISFDQPYGTFSSTGFPNATTKMVAPFWADVDTRGAGEVWYKVTPTALYVNWVAVGYFASQADKLNWFQLIITNGSDPVIGTDKNVSFCYKDMQWTTGGASGGTNGFGGTPATVGANRANNTGDYIQFGRFDQAGNTYDGPFANNDGVSWLDFKNFIFTTITATQNIPPIATGQFLCDTLRACVGQQAELELTFLSPENTQITTGSSSAPSIASWTEIANTNGIIASITGQFTPTDSDLGFHNVTYTATDDGVPNLTSTITIVIEVIPPPSTPPAVTGNLVICAGQTTTLTASGPFSSYLWSNGGSGSSITVSVPGIYSVVGGIGLCELPSLSVEVTQVVAPPLTVSGPAIYCGTPLPELVASPGYDSYSWSSGILNDTISVEGGTYTVTGTFQGCQNTSAPFVVSEVDPGPPVIIGEAQYCEGEDATLSFNSAGFDDHEWSTGATTPSITVLAGVYTVTANFLNCTYTSVPFTVEAVILPPVSVTGDPTFCEDSFATITATSGFESYSWNNNTVGQTINVGAGTYFVTAQIGPCLTFSNTFSVTELPSPTPIISGPAFSCGGVPSTLSTTESYSAYLWSEQSTGPSISAGTGTYSVTVTDANGCIGLSPAFVVTVGSDPLANFTIAPPSPQGIGTTAEFTDASQGNGSPLVDWFWEFGIPGENSSSPSTSYTFSSPGTYPITLLVTAADGCQDSLTQAYVIFPEDVIIPNVFTPNGDANNEFFDIENGEYYQNTLTVFNRWGQAVFEANNYRNGWRASGVPDGTYYYVFVLNESGKEYTGHVTILR